MSASKIMKKLFSLLCAGLVLIPASVLADYELNLTPSVTQLGRDIYDLHMLILWIVTIVGIGVFAVIIYSLINHRKSKGAVAAQFHESATVEFVWTVIPFIILVAIAVPATKTLLAIEDTSNPDLTIKATGWQWKWEYEYLDSGVHFFSSLDKASNDARQMNSGTDPRTVPNYLLDVDKPIVVPVNKKIRILTTANDVIHAWWVPELAIKRDAIPGFINESWFKAEKTGTYRGQCAELCGKDHGFMPIVVNVVSEGEYNDWIAKQKKLAKASAASANKTWSKADLMKRGQEVYNAQCAACHQANGQGIPGVFPAIAGGKITTGPVKGHIDIVVKGKAGTAMQAFGAQLNAADLAAVITYERNAFGNKTGDVVQPSQISK
ncbi:MAG: cytochrome c oxidase subunit II [Gammaproteobacteria bacterium]|nr:cytochrome c oxidase subunit II [Gammaproteobacteria bacterium]MDH5777463.1 cytochrome c oxidase subunit II [Gammaproteobacteria bacterium]